MERMGQPIADAYETVQSAVGSAMNVVFQLSSWFTDYETAPYTIMMHDDGVSQHLFHFLKVIGTVLICLNLSVF